MRQAGLAVVGAVEVDDLAARTYQLNHPRTRIWKRDIRDVDAAEARRELRLRPGRLDLLAACPPCQGFSSLRTLLGRKQVRDDRNDLIFEVLRFVKELRPKVVMIENVPGLAKDERLERFCGSLREMGYKCRVAVLDAADYRVPQRRRRMILVAGHRVHVPLARPNKTRVTVRQAIGWMPEPSPTGDPLHHQSANHNSSVLAIIKGIPKDGGSRTSLSAEAQLGCHRRCEGFFDVYGRMSWDDVSPTITSGCVNPSKGRFLHPEQNRAVTLREAALLQSFPADYEFSLDRGKYLAAEMIGNALPPVFIRKHVRAIIASLRRRHLRNDKPHSHSGAAGAQQVPRACQCRTTSRQPNAAIACPA